MGRDNILGSVCVYAGVVEMTAKQLHLDLRERKTRMKHGPKLAARMIAILAQRREWTTRQQMKAYGLTDRECRLAREWAHGRVLCGQKGYKLLRDATPDEIRACYFAFVAMIEAQQVQASWIMRRGHEALNKKGVA
jgi:hypothetical protein